MSEDTGLEFAFLRLHIEDSRKESAKNYDFSVAHFQFAMTVHNYICSKNDGREPSLYMVSGSCSEILNNRMEFERAKREMENMAQRPIIHPGSYPFPSM